MRLGSELGLGTNELRDIGGVHARKILAQRDLIADERSGHAGF